MGKNKQKETCVKGSREKVHRNASEGRLQVTVKVIEGKTEQSHKKKKMGRRFTNAQGTKDSLFTSLFLHRVILLTGFE